jgi:hypothetical protein
LATLVLWLLYASGVLGVVAAARFLRRPLPAAQALLFFALPVLFLGKGFVADTTPIPVEDVRLIPPWSALPPAFGTPEPTRNPNLNDVALQIAPWAKAVRVAWKSGEVPWLDRWNGCGTPLAANAQSAAFSPFTLLGFALPLARAFTLAGALKLFLALAGMALWLSELRVSRAASTLGAVAFAFSLEMTIWLPWPITAVVCLWPWALFLIERLDDADSRRRAAGTLAAVFVVWGLGGHPESAALGALLVGAWLVVRFAIRGFRNPRAVALSAVVAGALALGATAFLILPQIAAIGGSNRRANAEAFASSIASSWAFHAPLWRGGFVTPFIPRAYGDAIGAPMIPPPGYGFPEIATGYPGAIAWLLLFLVLRPGSARRRETLGLAAIAAFGIAEATWSWPLVELLARVPGIGVMLPLRFLGWVPIAVATLAAFEFDRLRADLSADSRQALWLGAAAAIFAAGGAAVFRHFRAAYVSAGGYASEKQDLVALGVVLAAAGLAAIFAALPRFSPALRARVLAVVLVGAAAAELFAVAQPLDRLGRSSFVFPETPLVRFLRTRPGVFRTAGVGASLFPNANVFAAVEDIRTHDPMERRDYVAFLDATCGYAPGEYFKFLRDLDSPALDFLNVRYAVAARGTVAPGPRWRPSYSGADGIVFENPAAMPRAFAPGTVRAIGSSGRGAVRDAFRAFGSAPAELLAGIDFHRDALVVSDGDTPIAAAVRRDNAAVISGIRERTNAVAFTAAAPESGAVAVVTVVQDGGWRARDERGPLAAGRANGPFLAVALRPGTHRVTVAYLPPGFRAGAAISAATLAAAAMGAAIAARRRRSLSR